MEPLESLYILPILQISTNLGLVPVDYSLASNRHGGFGGRVLSFSAITRRRITSRAQDPFASIFGGMKWLNLILLKGEPPVF